jgi:hypothetical protein
LEEGARSCAWLKQQQQNDDDDDDDGKNDNADDGEDISGAVFPHWKKEVTKGESLPYTVGVGVAGAEGGHSRNLVSFLVLVPLQDVGNFILRCQRSPTLRDAFHNFGHFDARP